MAEHPGLDELADAAESLLTADRQAAVADHLRECPDCRDAVARISAVPRLLAAKPRPSMPPEVARRLSGVVATEVSRRAARPPATLRRRPTLGDFDPPPARHRTAPRLVTALVAAAAALVVGFGGYVLSARAGLDEPQLLTSVSSGRLGDQAADLARSGALRPHRFSQAWLCARRVVDDPIVGLAAARVDGSPALLVYTRVGPSTRVTVVTGCSTTPAAGPSAAVPG